MNYYLTWMNFVNTVLTWQQYIFALSKHFSTAIVFVFPPISRLTYDQSLRTLVEPLCDRMTVYIIGLHGGQDIIDTFVADIFGGS